MSSDVAGNVALLDLGPAGGGERPPGPGGALASFVHSWGTWRKGHR